MKKKNFINKKKKKKKKKSPLIRFPTAKRNADSLQCLATETLKNELLNYYFLWHIHPITYCMYTVEQKTAKGNDLQC